MVQLYSLNFQEEENIDQQHTGSPDGMALAIERDHMDNLVGSAEKCFGRFCWVLQEHVEQYWSEKSRNWSQTL